MEQRILLHKGFDYDLWANRQWLIALGLFKTHIVRAQEVMEHILAAQRIWLERCGFTMFPEAESVQLHDLVEVTARAWQALLDDATGDEEIAYTTMRGETYTNTVATCSTMERITAATCAAWQKTRGWTH